jgi:hypothetical protein
MPLALALLAGVAAADSYGAPEPYKWLHGSDATALPPRAASPDPFVRFAWDSSIESSTLQQVAINSAVAVHAEPESAFEGLETLTDPSGNVSLLVQAPGWIRLDYGLERPAWLEGISATLNSSGQAHLLKASISEYDEPYDTKTQPVQLYPAHTFRLETPHPSHDRQLYEGVRYAWLCFAVDCPWTGGDAAPAPAATLPTVKPWRLTALRLVAKFQPVSYTGSFRSSDPRLEKIWYTGAYGIRSNMQGNDYGSILIDRGDRSAFQGDGHPSMAAAEAAFGSGDIYELTRLALEITDCHTPLGKQQVCRFPNGTVAMPKGSYPVYWTMSVCDYFWASGNVAEFNKLLPDVEAILDDQISQFDKCLLTDTTQQPQCNYEFIGWDDRTGIGGSNKMAAGGEPYRVFNSLVVRAMRELAACLQAVGGAAATAKAASYRKTADGFAAKIRAVQPVQSFLVHSAAHAINAGIFLGGNGTSFGTVAAVQTLFARNFNDSVSICSLSPFNTFYIVQALANSGYLEHALGAVNHCWEPMTTLGKGCFWELFDPEWAPLMHEGQKAPTRPSFCHPWSAGATPFLSKFILGVQPLTPGFESVTVTPFVSAAWPTVGGAVPVHSGRGVLTVNASYADTSTTSTTSVMGTDGSVGAATVSITLLSPVPATVGVPVTSAGGCTLSDLTVDGKAQVMPKPRSFGPVGLAYIFSLALPAGRRHIVLGHYSGCHHSATMELVSSPTPPASGIYPFPDPPKYKVTTTLDTTTHGAWRSKYGLEAYVMFGFDRQQHPPKQRPPAGMPAGISAGMDRVHIPPSGSFVKGFSFAKGCGNKPIPYWMANASGLPKQALLADPAGATSSLGFASGGGDGSQGTYLDVSTAIGTRYELAVYMVGSAGNKSIQVTRIMDLQVCVHIHRTTLNRTQPPSHTAPFTSLNVHVCGLHSSL